MKLIIKHQTDEIQLCFFGLLKKQKQKSHEEIQREEWRSSLLEVAVWRGIHEDNLCRRESIKNPIVSPSAYLITPSEYTANTSVDILAKV